MNAEMESMYFNQIWSFVDPPNGIKSIGCKWIYKRKRGIDRKMETFKARLGRRVIPRKKALTMKRPSRQ